MQNIEKTYLLVVGNNVKVGFDSKQSSYILEADYPSPLTIEKENFSIGCIYSKDLTEDEYVPDPLYGEYLTFSQENKFISICTQFVRENSSVIDVSGLKGGHFCIELSKRYPNCSFYNIYSNKMTVYQMCGNVFINDVSNVECLHLKLSFDDDYETIYGRTLDKLDIVDISLIRLFGLEYEIGMIKGSYYKIQAYRPIIVFNHLKEYQILQNNLKIEIMKFEYNFILIDDIMYVAFPVEMKNSFSVFLKNYKGSKIEENNFL